MSKSNGLPERDEDFPIDAISRLYRVEQNARKQGGWTAELLVAKANLCIAIGQYAAAQDAVDALWRVHDCGATDPYTCSLCSEAMHLMDSIVWARSRPMKERREDTEAEE